jgi:hypothetical protein
MSQATAAGARMCQGTFFFTRVARKSAFFVVMKLSGIRKKLPMAVFSVWEEKEKGL